MVIYLTIEEIRICKSRHNGDAEFCKQSIELSMALLEDEYSCIPHGGHSGANLFEKFV